MSWDVVIMDFGDYARVEDMPADYEPLSIGPLRDVTGLLRRVFPEFRVTAANSGRLQQDAGSVEFFFGNDDPVKSVVLSLRGGEAMVAVVHQVAELFGCRAYDCSTGDFLVPGEPAEGFSKWRGYRDQVLRRDRVDDG